MTLSDDLVARYSRQILVPEVGGRGQERLLAARVVVTGAGPAAAAAATLLGAAGVGVACADGPADRLAIATGGPAGVRVHVDGGRVRVRTLVGRPCVRCAPDDGPGRPADAPAAAQAVGALAAGEALRLLLGLATAGREQTVDLDDGGGVTRPLAATAGCAACGSP